MNENELNKEMNTASITSIFCARLNTFLFFSLDPGVEGAARLGAIANT